MTEPLEKKMPFSISDSKVWLLCVDVYRQDAYFFTHMTQNMCEA